MFLTYLLIGFIHSPWFSLSRGFFMFDKINIKIIIINACLLYKMFYICTQMGTPPFQVKLDGAST